MHADTDLSALLDGELAPAERARVEAHLDACAACRGRLAELRTAASLIGSLPYTRPSRSLVPAVAGRWVWLRPIRSLSMFASGAFLFVFLLTAVARSGAGLGGAGAPAAAPQPASSLAIGAGTAPQASGANAERSSAPAPAVRAPAPTQVPAPAAQFGTAAPAADQGRSTAGTAAPSALADAQKRQEAAASPAAGAPSEAVLRTVPGVHEPARNPLLEPLLWVVLAIVAAVIAIASHLRLRTR